MKGTILRHIILGLGYVSTGIWAIVEFILYLAKNDPFNWTSVILFIAFVVLAIVNMLAGAKKAMNNPLSLLSLFD